MMELDPIEKIEPDAWDEAISHFGTKYLFHQSAWLSFLEETHKGKVIRFRIVENGKVEGYFLGLLIKKGPIRILGSPLPGWTTDYMGPIVNKGFDFEKFLNALEDTCRLCRIDHVELCNPFLDPPIMRNMGFNISKGITFVVPLFSDEDQMWKNLKKKSCQHAIKKANREGLIVEENRNSSFVQEYYRELEEVFARQHLVPTYSIERVRSLLRHLRPDLLFALQVKYGDEIIATGIFPHDDRCVYFFGGASKVRFHGLNPNELLHWTAMTLSAKLGIQQYDMCGGGSFKPKFGGKEVPVYRYTKSYSIFAKLGREMYKFAFYAKQRFKGKFLNMFATPMD